MIRVSQRRVRSIGLAIVMGMAGLLCAATAPPACARIDWHDGLDDALAAAEESGKPIFAFVYLGDEVSSQSGPRERIRVRGGDESGRRLNVERMLDDILRAPEVISAAENFESVKIDLCRPESDDARRKLKVSPAVDESTSTRVGMYPITVFLEPSGQELFRRHGCMPAIGYAAQLGTARDLHEMKSAAEADPRDPVKRRQLGRAYMEMDPTPDDRIYQAAVENLEAAIRLDPDNETGAAYDARVDLAILSIPESPEQAIPKLFQLQSQDTDGGRKIEIQYYMAVAHFVMEDYGSAKRLLTEFETDNRESPYWDSPWTPQALGLLEHIKQIQQ